MLRTISKTLIVLPCVILCTVSATDAPLPEHRQRAYLDNCALGRLATPDELADYAVWLVSDENTFMTGTRIVVDGGL